MRKKSINLILSGLLLGTTTSFAMEKEGELEKNRTASLPIPTIQMTEQALPELSEFIGKPEAAVVKRRPSRTLPNESVLPVGGTRRTSSGSPYLSPPRVSPRAFLSDQAQSLSSREMKKESHKISLSPHQISGSCQQRYNEAPKRDVSPVRQRRSRAKSTSSLEHSGSFLYSASELLVSPGRISIPLLKDRELSPVREGNGILDASESIDSTARLEFLECAPKSSMKRYILDKEGQLHVVLPKSIPFSSQQDREESPAQEEKLASPKI